MDKREFINSIKEGALKGQTEHRIVPSLTIAQASLKVAGEAQSYHKGQIIYLV